MKTSALIISTLFFTNVYAQKLSCKLTLSETGKETWSKTVESDDLNPQNFFWKTSGNFEDKDLGVSSFVAAKYVPNVGIVGLLSAYKGECQGMIDNVLFEGKGPLTDNKGLKVFCDKDTKIAVSCFVK